MAAQVNVYVPDDLKTRLEEGGIALSRVARVAWERELARIEDAQLMGEIRKKTVDSRGFESELRFAGEQIVGPLYKTNEGKAVIVGVCKQGSDGDSECPGYHLWSPEEISASQDAFIDALGEAIEDGKDLRHALDSFDVRPIVRL